MIATWDREQVVREGDLLANSADKSVCLSLNTGAPETSRHDSEHIPHHASTFMCASTFVCSVYLIILSNAFSVIELNLLTSQYLCLC